MWKVAEDCYNQFVSRTGSLYIRDYFNPTDHVCRMQRESWIGFWVRALYNSPGRPTLFYPPASTRSTSLDFHSGFQTQRLPRLLFRTFDAGSWGTNGEKIIASIASGARPSQTKPIDILALDEEHGAEMLGMHLDRYCPGNRESDNLVSWTSSLLFAIQYAIFRGWRDDKAPLEIMICAADTTRFPQGQFARDTWLIAAHQSDFSVHCPAQSFFNFRLDKDEYYNGEYLSQGKLSIFGRSSVVSLQDLIDSGLYRLYPEFTDPLGERRWAKRVAELRNRWATNCSTSDDEIQIALQVAQKWFPLPEHTARVAAMLLSFKNRAFKTNTDTCYDAEWADKPAEVHRYWLATEVYKAYESEHPRDGQHGYLTDKEYLRSIFA